MTREEKIDAFTMRLDGYTLQEIGDKYGLTKERIRQMFAAVTTESGDFQKDFFFGRNVFIKVCTRPAKFFCNSCKRNF